MKKHVRILIAEDNSDHAELSKITLLRNYNCIIDIAYDGKDCLNKLKDGNYDILLLDYMLPDIDGLEVLSVITKQEIIVAVIMITGQGDEKIAVEAMKAGAYDYIVKTTGYLTTLPLIIKKAIEKHSLTIAHQEMEKRLVEQNKTLSILYQASTQFNQPTLSSEFIGKSFLQILDLMKFDFGSIYLFEVNSIKTSNIFFHGLPKESQDKVNNLILNDELVSKLHKSNKTYITSDKIIKQTKGYSKSEFSFLSNFNIFLLKSKNKNIGFFLAGNKELHNDGYKIVESLLSQLVVAIERNYLYLEEKKTREFSDNLRSIAEIINSSLDIDKILNTVLEKIIKIMKVSCGAIFIFDPHSNLFEYTYEQGLLERIGNRIKLFDKAHSPYSSVYNYQGKPLQKNEAAYCEEDCYKSFISMPIKNNNVIIGIIDLGTKEERNFSTDENKLLSAISNQIGITIEKARLFQQVKGLKEFNENIVQNLEEGILLEDEQSYIKFSNPKMEEMGDYTKEDLLKQKFFDLIPTYYHDAIKPTREQLQNGSPCRFEAALKHPENEIPIQVSCHPLFENNKFKGTISVIVDISETKKLEKQLIQSEKLSAIGQLISGVAHEVNNPITSIIGLSRLISQKTNDSAIKNDLNIINKESSRCHKIVQNLLAFSREHKPEKMNADIHQIIDSVLDLRSYQLNKDNIKIKKDYDSNIPNLFIDFHQFQQVFFNLITNAHQIVTENDEGIIKITTHKNIDKVDIIISDNGPGIDENILDKIFDPFFTTKKKGKGTGLGLSICYGIIKNHNGNINARNNSDKGAEFHIEIPIVNQLNPQKNSYTSKVKEVDLNPKKILIIDDEHVIIDLLQRLLSKEGHNVDIAENGKIALEKIKINDYELIISDLKMPGMSGKTLFKKLGKINPDLQKKMIFTTGDADSYDAHEFLSKCGCKYINKPFSFEQLKDVISSPYLNKS